MDMKLSELKKQIKDNIYEILSENTTPTVDTIQKTYNEMVGKNPQTTLADVAKKLNVDDVTITKALMGDFGKMFESEDEDREPTKAELEKEKVKGAPSKFKISDEKYKELKNKLKTVVEKVKDLDKKIKDPYTKKSELDDLKDQKLKKMEALKKFMKNDELVKAFKERDVKIDTGGLVGKSDE